MNTRSMSAICYPMSDFGIYGHRRLVVSSPTSLVERTELKMVDGGTRLASGPIETIRRVLRTASLECEPNELDAFRRRLQVRRATMKERAGWLADCASPSISNDVSWLSRTYSIVSVLAPALTNQEGKIEYPGDPMCLYGALAVSIDSVMKSRHAECDQDDRYNDLCPQWGFLPTANYRENTGDQTLRQIATEPRNTDQTIFDPRVWNAETREYFIEFLKAAPPRVVLISSVSCAHRYAVDIAAVVKAFDPSIIVIMGGRHADETVRFNNHHDDIELSYSSTLRGMADGRLPDVVDFVVAGEAHYGLDLLLRAISISMSLDDRQTTIGEINENLRLLAAIDGVQPGRFIIVTNDSLAITCLLNNGNSIDLSSLPNYYKPFSIRARFPIFPDEFGVATRTAHMITTSACPYQCSFCSEAVSVVGRMMKYSSDPVITAIGRLEEFARFGAEATFFDDSVMFGGNVERIKQFCQEMAWRRKETGAEINRQPSIVQWGAQLTVEFLAAFRSEDAARTLLKEMREAGCTYIYFGLESLAPDVINRIHKNRLKVSGEPWETKAARSLKLVKEAGIVTGTALLFGLDGESRETINYTIDGVARFIAEGIIDIASPNIVTYHPATQITRMHQMESQIDYHSIGLDTGPPYVYFEQAFKGVVSKFLTEDDIWHIHRETKKKWGNSRNSTSMVLTAIPDKEQTAW